VSQIIAGKDIVIDKMHMKGHTDKWCKENCDPKSRPELEKVKFSSLYQLCVNKL
jgi:hypothetical protein